jgi:hypothetical protein
LAAVKVPAEAVMGYVPTGLEVVAVVANDGDPPSTAVVSPFTNPL